ncbi:hypothetical protein [Amycolatopsis saalfeldensis]|uniref:Uncharacterized conserved protein YraI n=1 Tax=Amycolatopsis saalfeldensis TaxID=394193 RepID=A0A1H8YE58_9PSEU|nr:hypothetical protein [Amycolatopsis saalfeldensis]SEP50397.1 Uncharacterized conserved protein YraI [Amycolatopsis saalfeldensis]
MKRSKLRRWAGLGVVLASAGAFALATAVPAAAAVTGTVQTAGDPLNVRRAPNTAATAVKTVANGASVGIECQTAGNSVTGPLGTTTIWDYVPALGGYVSDGYVKTGSDGRVAPDCGTGTGSAQCASACAAEGLFRSSDAHFVVYDTNADGSSGVVQYWLATGAGPFYVWASGGNGTSVDKAVPVPKGSWVFYKTCTGHNTSPPTFAGCSAGLTDFAA